MSLHFRHYGPRKKKQHWIDSKTYGIVFNAWTKQPTLDILCGHHVFVFSWVQRSAQSWTDEAREMRDSERGGIPGAGEATGVWNP